MRAGVSLGEDGESLGSTAITWTPGFAALSAWPVPVTVPPVPTPATRMSTAPSVSRRISCAVVSRWIWGFAAFSNWRIQIAPGVSATMRLVSSIAPLMPLVGSVSTISAPNAFSRIRRSFDIEAGIVRMTR